VAKLEAAEEIRRLKVRYAKACDNDYAPEGIRPLFTEDGIWSDTRGRFTGTHVGLDAICEFFANAAEKISWAGHYMIGPDIEVDDDLVNATGTWYLWQPCTIDGEPAWISGTYDDVYRCEDGVWKMAKLELTLDFVSPYEAGWIKQPFMV
jgi:hypothetical protein